MAKIKYTKGELKRQKDDLVRFNRYLPTLELKKLQLVAEVRRVQGDIAAVEQELDRAEQEVSRWAAVFAEPVDLQALLAVRQVRTGQDNIAGIDIPVFEDVEFDDRPYDLLTTPLWVDRGLAAVKEQVRRRARRAILRQQEDILREEMRVTVQRLKLFEQVRIPQARERIRAIRIFLGDQQTAAVVRGKIAKGKLERRQQGTAVP